MLEEWQKRQNGSLHRVEDTINKLYLWTMGILVTTLITLVSVLLTNILAP